MTDRARYGYRELVRRFRRVVRRAVPSDATVVVVSRGDDDLLAVGVHAAWHFPQRADGVYAGYYPESSQAAIQHLDALREKGAEFLALPATALWWLEHYPDLARHLETLGRLVVRDESSAFVYSLFQPGARPPHTGAREHPLAPTGRMLGHRGPTAPSGSDAARLAKLLDADVVDDVRALFDPEHYAAQVGTGFDSPDEALLHHLTVGHRFDPHPLFDTRWYVARHPEVRASGVNPLVHFVRNSAGEWLDPNPYFDTELYWSQASAAGAKPGDTPENALVHYIRSAPSNRSYHPNALFRDGFYLKTYPEANDGAQTPLEHFLRYGCDNGHFASPAHRSMFGRLRRSAGAGLWRGRWRRGTLLLFSHGDDSVQWPNLAPLAPLLADRHHLDPVLVRFSPGDADEPPDSSVLTLQDYEVACEVFRPASLRLLVKLMGTLRPAFALSDVHEVLEGLSLSGIPAHFLLAEPEGRWPDRPDLEAAFRSATRVIVPSARAFSAAGRSMGWYPANVARRPLDPENGDGREPSSSRLQGFVDSMRDLVRRDFRFDLHGGVRAAASSAVKGKIVIPCCDWGVSGVNTSLEAIGAELIRLGWEVELIFTRDETTILDSAQGRSQMPAIPYRYLHRDRKGVDGMWAGLIADLESRAPCILFSSYDFFANSVVPALTDRVGAVLWAQSDDGDYYEQIYRLGRYCNTVVCVSEFIKDKVTELNPAIGERCHVIYNSSVRGEDVCARRRPPGERMQLVYAGRLVQYQKRVLDYLDLATELDRLGVAYSISLIGAFSPRENAEELLLRHGADHLADGRLRLLGRLPRRRILEELTHHEFFVLLSEFEGLPLALVEAMARGCVPVVAQVESGIPELVSNGVNGLVLEGREYEKWAHQLVQIRDDRPRLTRMSRNARSTVRRGFTVEQLAAEFDALFLRIAQELAAGAYQRPPCLNWGPDRSPTGDVLAPPPVHRPAAVKLPGLG